jgi:hypothetical protein
MRLKKLYVVSSLIGWLSTIGILYWLLRAAAKGERKRKHRYYTLKTAKYMGLMWMAGFGYLAGSLVFKVLSLILN